MPRTGRPPKPLQLHKLVGTFRADRHGGGQVVPPAEPADCPAWVDERARPYWEKISATLLGMGLMSKVYTVPLGLLVDSLAEYIHLKAMVEESGRTIETDKGNVIQHPLVGQRNKAFGQVKEMLREFGMTPSSLTGVKTPEVKADETGKSRFFRGGA